MDNFWSHFKSGTDIRGVAVDGIEGEPLDMTDEVIEAIIFAFVYQLSVKSGKPANELKISVGRDSRISGERIRNASVKAMLNAGVSVLDCSLASTPAMFMTTVCESCDGAVQITASHHPYHRNGLKFFLPTGGYEGSDISELLSFASQGKKPPENKGTLTEIDFMSRYCEILRNMIIKEVGLGATPLKGFHIVVDAGNGVGGFYAEKVLKPLGADISGSQFLEPDGYFPNHIPNPENKEAMAAICEATVKNNADLGVIFDTDVDRAGCVAADGKEINRNRLVALAAAIALENCKGGVIVTDSVTSDGLKTFIEKDLGGKHLRFKRGYKNVINESIRLNNEGIDSPLAIETSGHAALKENYFLDDGAYLITKIIIKAAKLKAEGSSIDELIKNLAEPLEAAEIRFNIKTEDFKAYGNDVLVKLEAFAKANGFTVADDSHEGVRISFDGNSGDGWLLLRLSVHDPVMPMNIESNIEGGCKIIAKKIADFISEFDMLDTSAYDKFIK